MRTFSRQMEAIVFNILQIVFATRAVLKLNLGNIIRIISPAVLTLY